MIEKSKIEAKNLEFKEIEYIKEGNIAWIRLNVPSKLNRFSTRMALEILKALEMADEDKEVGAVIIIGNGSSFSAGGDLSEMGGEDWDIESGRNFMEICIRLIDLVKSMSKVVIAAVRGYAAGAGNELALICDLTIASEDAKFGQPEIKVGSTGMFGGTQLLPLIIGEKRARWMMLTGEFIDAKTAEQWGLVNKVVPNDRLEEEARELAKKIASNVSPQSLKIIKLGLGYWYDSIRPAFTHAREITSFVWNSPEFRELRSAFIEKREPKIKREYDTLISKISKKK